MMSTLEIRSPHTLKARPTFGAISRLAATFMIVLDVFAEAKRQAHEAQRRYPFTAW
jgi:hypothetical protein